MIPTPTGTATTAATIAASPVVSTTTGDLVITGGQLQFTYGTAYIAQLIRSRLLLFQGEYIFDTTQGMPWLQSILIKGVNPNAVRNYFSQMILGTPGVQSIQTLTLNFNFSQRTLSVNLVAQTNLGLLTTNYQIPLVPGD